MNDVILENEIDIIYMERFTTVNTKSCVKKAIVGICTMRSKSEQGIAFNSIEKGKHYSEH